MCVDSSGYVASAVSSGGLLLKHTGRVGQAAVYGCGCWAENNCDGMYGHVFYSVVYTAYLLVI